MALVNCPECGREVSNTALACPNCGFAVNEYYIKRCSNSENAKADEVKDIAKDSTEAREEVNISDIPMPKVPVGWVIGIILSGAIFTWGIFSGSIMFFIMGLFLLISGIYFTHKKLAIYKLAKC